MRLAQFQSTDSRRLSTLASSKSSAPEGSRFGLLQLVFEPDTDSVSFTWKKKCPTEMDWILAWPNTTSQTHGHEKLYGNVTIDAALQEQLAQTSQQLSQTGQLNLGPLGAFDLATLSQQPEKALLPKLTWKQEKEQPLTPFQSLREALRKWVATDTVSPLENLYKTHPDWLHLTEDGALRELRRIRGRMLNTLNNLNTSAQMQVHSKQELDGSQSYTVRIQPVAASNAATDSSRQQKKVLA
ncbi:MAG: hypothetical protein SFZ03_01970 [Candidatus Melainabacteria bacterium]|nr:hypothetical protein [Candidatus Melainabacteria bacterium]